jgi:ATP synthase protein I
MQVLTIIVIASGFFLVGTKLQAISALLGGVTAFLPNLYFGLKISSVSGGDAKKIVRSFYTGESGKLILTVLLFCLIFQFPNIELFPVMLCFVATLSVFWFALIIRD